ncbi:hypothetical protein [Streptomyces sp. t39]|uniref:hypothetical protein n=1 Tax=Streptomyces sp. t39 TaxID=1828156 RepID=UPI0011CE0244|nr:hypothetical protein [Streptomyces sp. t39]TXS58097.1 hypothetical protein EAO77_00790 [Streptomyces sp. t39]
MITGCDTVLLAHGPVPEAIERFLGVWSQRWPHLRIAVGDEDTDVFSPWTPGATAWDGSTGRLLVARDEEMVAGWDETGYVLDATGEGPFSLAYEPAGWRSLKALALEDPYVRTGFGYEPYEVTLVGSGLRMITVVAPDEGEFGRTVVDTLTACLDGGPDGG